MRMTMQQLEADLSAEFGGPAIGAWPRNKGERMRPHKGGGGDPGAEARRQEAERQARIAAATEQINAIFNNQVKKTRMVEDTSPQAMVGRIFRGGGNQEPRMVAQEYWEAGDPANSRDKLYADQKTAVYDLNKREVDRQAAEAERLNRFGLARTGLLGGSVNVDSVADLDRRTNEGLMRAGGIADQAAADLKTQDERTRSNLISLAQSGIDTGTAAQQALKGLEVNAANAASARAGSTVGQLFNDLSQAYLFNQQNQGRQTGQMSGQQWYGVSSTRSGGTQGTTN
jgi:hypothetical protein